MSILDAFPYPWHSREARDLHTKLTQTYPDVRRALALAREVNIDTLAIIADSSPAMLWRDLLDQSASEGNLRAFVQHLYDILPVNSPTRPFLRSLLNNVQPVLDAEPSTGVDPSPFLRQDDSISEPEALLYYDDLTIEVGKIPQLITTLTSLAALAPAVCRLLVTIQGLPYFGTGFRIGEKLLLTNWHVLHDQYTGAPASAVTAQFRYEDDGQGGELAPAPISCDVHTIRSSKEDDWAVIQTSQPLLASWPIICLSTNVQPVPGNATYIVQHPGGSRKRLGYVRNLVSFVDDRVVQYLTDTQGGSSGSPVFDAAGRVIALHHMGGQPQQVAGRAPIKKNEGIHISRILAGFAQQGIVVP
ncbi:trypsin-like serine peptidase [Hymenobacter tenuis]